MQILVAALETAGYGEAELDKSCQETGSGITVDLARERHKPGPGTQVSKTGNNQNDDGKVCSTLPLLARGRSHVSAASGRRAGL
ncbi:hypothetical protein, partial [Mesorhizobium sp.]|uniref:hypothetical protein n=1 Tax=Mesorhizobium sp. TaxID=1871066 RepID=UPI00257F3787